MSEITNIIEKCFSSGLYNISEESYFAWQGCNMCNDENGRILGNTVYDIKGYMSLDDCKAENYYEFRLCGECINKLVYGE